MSNFPKPPSNNYFKNAEKPAEVPKPQSPLVQQTARDAAAKIHKTTTQEKPARPAEAKMDLPEYPAFERTKSEKMALLVSAKVAGKPNIQVGADENIQRQAAELFDALNKGSREKIFALSQEMHDGVVTPARVALSVARIEKEGKAGVVPMVLNFLKRSLGNYAVPDSTQVDQLPLSEALVCILLELTHSKTNLISHSNEEARTVQTFYFNKKSIYEFLAAMGLHEEDVRSVVYRALLIKKVNGNVVDTSPALEFPAREVVRLHDIRFKEYQQKKEAAMEAARQSNAASVAPQRSAIMGGMSKEAKEFQQEVSGMIDEVSDARQKMAVKFSLMGESLKTLLTEANKPTVPDIHFQAVLNDIYASRLTKAEALDMSSKMYRKVRNLMRKAGKNQEFSRALQDKLRELGLIKDDMDKWMSVWGAERTGKQELDKPFQTRPQEEAPKAPREKTLAERAQEEADRVKRAQKRQEEEAKMNTTRNLMDAWQKKNSGITIPHEQTRVLSALSNPDNVNEIIELAIHPEKDGPLWAQVPEHMQQELYRVFALNHNVNFQYIKESFLASAKNEEEKELATPAIRNIEKTLNDIAKLFQKNHKMDLGTALEYMYNEEAAADQKERRNSLEYRSSVAAQYGKYN